MIARLLCDHSDNYEDTKRFSKRSSNATSSAEDDADTNDDDEDENKDKNSASDKGLTYKSFKIERGTDKDPDDDYEVLRVEWTTKFACRNVSDGQTSSGTHWGFFTWFIIMYVFPVSSCCRSTFPCS